MTELTELLYDYALERSSIGLQSQEYREVSALAKQLEIRLRQELPPRGEVRRAPCTVRISIPNEGAFMIQSGRVWSAAVSIF